uniref:Uncharacterized protein n=1 Tax=Tanacetum cinerariifolium TaxID=118510 RepID=A0A6L2M6N4_TANCI|nr:hypothetical protein [Tanacetum cinerariifolium]
MGRSGCSFWYCSGGLECTGDSVGKGMRIRRMNRLRLSRVLKFRGGKQNKIYKIDMDHANKVLSMQKDEIEPVEVQEVVDVVTTAKLITKVVTVANETVTAARVVISDPKEDSTTSTSIIIHETKSKDKGKGILVKEPKPLKKKQQIKMDEEYARMLHAELNQDINWDVAIDHVKLKAKEDPAEESRALQTINETLTEKAAKRRKLNKEVEDLKRHLEIIPNEGNDVYTEATPLARKVTVVDYEIIEINNKPYYKIIRPDGSYQLYISFLDLLKNFDREDLKALWNLVKESLEESKDYTWSSKGQELEATGIMWCAYHNIYNHVADFVSGKKASAIRPLLFTVEALEARELELRRVSLALTLFYLDSKSLVGLSLGKEIRVYKDGRAQELNPIQVSLYQSPQYRSPYQSQQYSTNQPLTPLLITYPSNDYQSLVHHNIYPPHPSIHQLEYAPTVNHKRKQLEFPQQDSSLTVLVFKQGDAPINAINHMMSFLSAVVTSRYPTTNNKLRNSLNPRQQATINDGRVTLQPLQGRQISTRTYTLRGSRSNFRKQRIVICYNFKGEVHMSKQCIKPKGNGMMLDLGNAKGQATQTVITHNGAYQVNDLDTYDSDCDELNTAKVALMANLSQYGSDVLPEIHNPDNMDNNMINQGVQAMPSSEQSSINAMIDRLKQTLSEQLQEKESLIKTFTVPKNDFKKEESRNVDREIALEKKIKYLDNIVYKRHQSAQTVHMLTKPNFFYDHTTKQALGFQNPLYLKKSQQLEPKLYDGNVIKNTYPITIPDSEETLMLVEENPSHSCTSTRVEVPKELPKVSMEKGLIIAALKDELRKLKGKASVDNVVTTYNIATEMLKIDVKPIALRLLNNRTAHSDYLRLTQEQAVIFKKVVPSGNTKKDKIQRPPSSTQKNKVEPQPRTVKSSLKNKNCAVEPKGTAIVQHYKFNANSELICVKCNGCMLSDNHDFFVLNVTNNVNARPKSKSVKKT